MDTTPAWWKDKNDDDPFIVLHIQNVVQKAVTILNGR